MQTDTQSKTYSQQKARCFDTKTMPRQLAFHSFAAGPKVSADWTFCCQFALCVLYLWR